MWIHMAQLVELDRIGEDTGPGRFSLQLSSCYMYMWAYVKYLISMLND